MNTKVVFLCFCFEDKITLQNWTCSFALSLLNKHWKKKGGGPPPSLRGCWLDWVVLTCFKSVVQSGYSQHVGWDGCILCKEPVSLYLLNIRLSYEHFVAPLKPLFRFDWMTFQSLDFFSVDTGVVDGGDAGG